MILVTERLMLREYVEEDWKQVHEYASDAELVKFMDWGPNTIDDTKDFLRVMLENQKTMPRTNFGFAMTLLETGMLIGGCELDIQEHSQASMGYCLNRKYWGQGFATEAASALCRFGFAKLGLHRIVATCRPENVASAKVMENVGMKREGVLRENFFAKGRWQDSLLYSILVHEFPSLDWQSCS